MLTLYFGAKIVWALLCMVALAALGVLAFGALVLYLLGVGVVVVVRGVYGVLQPAEK
jgi:hypothetical protein